MSHYYLGCLIFFVAFASIAMGKDKQRTVQQQLKYLDHLQLAETMLDNGQADAALAELEQAFACDFPDSFLARVNLKTRAAAAHYLTACAHAAKGDAQAALGSLREAARNGYRNTALVESDPRLAAIRGLSWVSAKSTRRQTDFEISAFRGRCCSCWVRSSCWKISE